MFFLGGLRRPKMVQVASELAMTQQVELNPMKSKSKNLFDNNGFSRLKSKLSSVGDKGKPMMKKDESKTAEPSRPTGPFEKLLALQAYRRANNLLFHLWREVDRQKP